LTKLFPPDLEDQAGIGAVGKIDIGDIPPAAIDLYSPASGNTRTIQGAARQIDLGSGSSLLSNCRVLVRWMVPLMVMTEPAVAELTADFNAASVVTVTETAGPVGQLKWKRMRQSKWKKEEWHSFDNRQKLPSSKEFDFFHTTSVLMI